MVYLSSKQKYAMVPYTPGLSRSGTAFDASKLFPPHTFLGITVLFAFALGYIVYSLFRLLLMVLRCTGQRVDCLGTGLRGFTQLHAVFFVRGRRGRVFLHCARCRGPCV